MSLIVFESVVKAFDARRVLDGLSFAVEPGEVLAVVGPSGTGKSVTLKHIVRLLAPDEGRVLVDGVDVATASPQALAAVRRRIGYLFQSGALLAWKTVRENVALPLRECTRLSDGEIDRRVAEALAAVDLTEAADKFPAEISGGMQKRAGLARAIVREADIILYDEPTSGLDPVTSATIHQLIRRLNRTRSITSVVVTHDLAGALKIAHRVLLLKDGRAVECAAPEAFLASSSPDVREFVAAMKGERL
jgi:phospholipid/cholesterol/gamma-HCH transport system ATP-binding protein